MALTVRRITLWRTEVDNKPGVLAKVLGPLADAGADLQVVMGYRFPGNETKAAIEVYPVSGKKATSAATSAGLNASTIPTLLVEGDNRQGLGKVIAEAIKDAGINLGFLVTQVIGRRYSSVIGFENEEDAKRAASLIKKVTAGKKK
ncbi:MAG TPA: hypothetical protein VFM05_11790 [Candidatus Saccharimonadales bacterium]|nr:hypothetical protein [Candidatus Saccharimonadales bacterium]